jgi:hypothetical protein
MPNFYYWWTSKKKVIHVVPSDEVQVIEVHFEIRSRACKRGVFTIIRATIMEGTLLSFTVIAVLIVIVLIVIVAQTKTQDALPCCYAINEPLS